MDANLCSNNEFIRAIVLKLRQAKSMIDMNLFARLILEPRFHYRSLTSAKMAFQCGILKYFAKKNENYPDPSLTKDPATWHAANEACKQIENRSRKCGTYHHLSAEKRAKVGKCAAENGNIYCIRKFSPDLGYTLPESTTINSEIL